MSDDGDQDNNERGGAGMYSVGYKSPPPQHRFQKGRSGNPRGRPRHRGKHADASEMDAEALMLHEAYRMVSIREGDRIIKMPAIQAVMRGLGVAAMKGNPRAQLADRPIINVPYVSTYALGHLLDGRGFPPQAIDLGPAGQTRLYVKSAIVIGDKNPILIV